jgi:hypothetical protein
MLCWGTEYDERLRGYARELGVDVEIFHSNIEGEIVNRLNAANDERFGRSAPLESDPVADPRRRPLP